MDDVEERKHTEENGIYDHRNAATIPIFGIDTKGNGLSETFLTAENTCEASFVCVNVDFTGMKIY